MRELRSIWKGLSAPRKRSRRGRERVGRVERRRRPARRFAICRRRCLRATGALTSTNAEVLAIVKGGVGVPAAKAGEEVEVVLDHTSFYGDSGGQIGDTGVFLTVDGNSTVAEIVGCVLPVQGVRAHKAILKQDLAVGDRVNTVVDGVRTRRDPAESYGDAFAARGAETGAGHACEAGGVAGGS